MFGRVKKDAALAERAVFDEAMATWTQLRDLCATVPFSAGSRVCSTFKMKGGAGNTSTVASVSSLLSTLLSGQLIVVDANPDRATLQRRLMDEYRRGHLIELITDANSIRYPMELMRYLDAVGRMGLLHKSGVPSKAIGALTTANWDLVVDLASRFAQLTMIDNGTSFVSNAAIATAYRSDHLVISLTPEPEIIEGTMAEVTDFAHTPNGFLLRTATVVLSHSNPAIRITPLVQMGIDKVYQRFPGRVVEVPFDEAIGRGGRIVTSDLSPATQAAHARIALQIVEAFRRPSRAELDARSSS